MTNLSTFEGLLACILIFITSCVHFRRVKAFKELIMKKQFGPLSVFQKASVIGLRLQVQIGLICTALAFYILFR